VILIKVGRVFPDTNLQVVVEFVSSTTSKELALHLHPWIQVYMLC